MQMESLHTTLGELFARHGLEAEGIEVARGTVIFDQGDNAQDIYCIHRGQVRMVQVGPDGDERLSDILGPGQWFGCGALSDGQVRTARAVSASAGQLSRMSAAKLLEHAANHPAIATQLIRQLATRIQAVSEDVARLQFQDCNQRLIQALLRFSHSAAATVQGSDVVLHLTHAQLAQAVGAARETVSLALTVMRQQNLVRTGRNRLLFNREALSALVSPLTNKPAA
jgi:CRP/FNR family cyclic AMP-dependent transcriptional regulator